MQLRTVKKIDQFDKMTANLNQIKKLYYF